MPLFKLRGQTWQDSLVSANRGQRCKNRHVGKRGTHCKARRQKLVAAFVPGGIIEKWNNRVIWSHCSRWH